MGQPWGNSGRRLEGESGGQGLGSFHEMDPRQRLHRPRHQAHFHDVEFVQRPPARQSLPLPHPVAERETVNGPVLQRSRRR